MEVSHNLALEEGQIHVESEFLMVVSHNLLPHAHTVLTPLTQELDSSLLSILHLLYGAGTFIYIGFLASLASFFSNILCDRFSYFSLFLVPLLRFFSYFSLLYMFVTFLSLSWCKLSTKPIFKILKLFIKICFFTV